MNEWKIVLKGGFGGLFSVLGSPVEPFDGVAQAALIESVAAESACDPAPCREVEDYRTRIQPRYVGRMPKCNTAIMANLFDGRVSAKTVRLFVKCMAAERDVAAFEMGVFETCCRQHTAKRRKDKRAEELQKKHKKALILACAEKKMAAIEAWLALLAHMKNEGLVGKPVPDPAKFLERIRVSGLPEAELKLLKANGVSDQQVEDFRQWMLKSYVQSAPKSFEEGVLNMLVVHADNIDMETCRCDEKAAAA